MTYRSFSLIPSAINDNFFSDRIDRMDKLFSKLTGNEPLSNIPHYDLLQKNDSYYELIVSVPGYTQKDLSVSLQNNQLSISGKIISKQNEKDIKWLHKGIFYNNFSLSFSLDNKVKIKNANLANGLLKLELEYKIPENEKLKKININTIDSKSHCSQVDFNK